MTGPDLDRRVAEHVVRADVDAFAARRIRARAHDQLRARRVRFTAWLEPVLALAFGGVQLFWAVRAVLFVYR